MGFVALVMLGCADPPGDARLVLTIIATNHEAPDVLALSARFSRIEVLQSSALDGEVSRVREVKAENLNLDFEHGTASATFVLETSHGFVHQLRFVAPTVSVGLASGRRDAKLPAGEQTGIRIVPAGGKAFPVVSEGTTYVEARFEAGRQVVRPPGQGFLFKPTIEGVLVEIQDDRAIKPYFEPRQVYVIFKDGTSEAQMAAAHAAVNATELRRYWRRPWVTVQTDAEGREHSVAAAYRGRPEVAWAAPNYNVTSSDGTRMPREWVDDPAIAQRWSVVSRAPEAWDIVQGSRHTIVAILDDGFGFHDEIEDNVFLNAGEFPSRIRFDRNCQPLVTAVELPVVVDVAGGPGGAPDGVITIADFNAPATRGDWLPLVGKDPGDPDARVRIDDLIKLPENACGIFEDGVDTDENGFTDDIAGWSFPNDSNNFEKNTSAEPSHGTTVAAIVGASESSTSAFAGVPRLLLANRVGVAWRTRLLLLRVIGDQAPLGENAHRAMDYAALMGAQVANMSASTVCIGPGVPLPGVSEARRRLLECDVAQREELSATWPKFVETANAGHILFTTGATNQRFDVDSLDVTVMPAEAAIPNMIAVANMDEGLGLPADRAPWGVRTFDLAAIGVGIPMLTPVGFPYNASPFADGFARTRDEETGQLRVATSFGTSFAAPQVAGAATLLLDLNPARYLRNPSALKAAILDGAGASTKLDGKVQAGRYLNVEGAVSRGLQDTP